MHFSITLTKSWEIRFLIQLLSMLRRGFANTTQVLSCKTQSVEVGEHKNKWITPTYRMLWGRASPSSMPGTPPCVQNGYGNCGEDTKIYHDHIHILCTPFVVCHNMPKLRSEMQIVWNLGYPSPTSCLRNLLFHCHTRKLGDSDIMVGLRQCVSVFVLHHGPSSILERGIAFRGPGSL